MITATIDLEDIRTYRNAKRAHAHMAGDSKAFPRINVDFSLSPDHDATLPTAMPMQWVSLRPEQEIALVHTNILILYEPIENTFLSIRALLVGFGIILEDRGKAASFCL